MAARALFPFALVRVVAALSPTCSQVADLHPNIPIEYPLSPEYITSQTEYWSTACGDLKPGCIFEPTSTEQVAQIVEVLRSNNETFAIKSGGHNPNNYFASVAGGPLISTKQLNEVTLDKSTGTVRVGPGNRWDNVSAALEGTGYSVVGGRLGNVGVGGYMLGGLSACPLLLDSPQLTHILIRWTELYEHTVRMGCQQCPRVHARPRQRHHTDRD